MKVVVAGGTGFVGRALVASLEADGHAVVVVTRYAARGRARSRGSTPPARSTAPTRSSTSPARRSAARAGRGGART